MTFEPQIFTVETTAGGNTVSWNLLTVDGETPRDTVYFMHKDDAPSSEQSNQINEAIESEEWEVSSCDEEDIVDYAIDATIFETAGEDYIEIYNSLLEILSLGCLYINDHSPEMNCFGSLEEVLSRLQDWDWEETDQEFINQIQIENITMLLQNISLAEARKYADNFEVL